MKRPSNLLPIPDSKHARHEIPPLLPDRRLQRFREDLEDLAIGPECTDEQLKLKLNLYNIHGIVHSAIQCSRPQDEKRPVVADVFIANVQDQCDFFQLLREVVRDPKNGDGIQKLVSHSAFWTGLHNKFTLKPEPPARGVPTESQHKAIENSWTAAFVNTSPLDALRKHIADVLMLGLAPSPLTTRAYGRYCSIVQSSGMGKSRLLDEFSKKYFMIPINLRDSREDGYPPADHEVRTFLTKGCQHSLAVSTMQHFLLALFEKTSEVLRVTNMGFTASDRIQNFRDFMSKGQSMYAAGENRNKFYDDVVGRARPKSNASDELDSNDIMKALTTLRNVLNSGGEDLSEHSVAVHKTPSIFVDVFIAFDEAHTLTDTLDDEDESRFVVLRRILGTLSSAPLFSFFLSTTGKVTQFGQPRGQDRSARINNGQLATPRPFIYLGFDQFMQSQKIFDKWKTLDDVTSMKCAAHMGRPLWGSRYDHSDEQVRGSLLDFAVQKLLCPGPPSNTLNNAQMYAVLSQRLALDIHTPQYLFDSASPLDAMQTMHEQIANHMRVCVAVGSGIESLRGIASSEPILSEAASRIMSSPQFSLPNALKLVLNGFSVDQGDRGELLVAAFFTWARDRVISTKPRASEMLCYHFSVEEFFSHLFFEPTLTSILNDVPSLCHERSPRPFRKAFVNSRMHFNHVIKPQVQHLLSRRFLLYFMARGAAALGANCQPGFDAVYPYLYNSPDLVLDVKKVGFIIVQVKNDPNVTRSDHANIFKKMDPFTCGILNDSDKDDASGRFLIPIIRILFNLSGREVGVSRMEYSVPSQGAESLGEDGNPLFTSYDYVCSGVKPEFLQPVQDSPDCWKTLVNKRDPWRSFYDVPEPSVLRSQMPGCGDDEAHFGSWLGATVFP